MSIWGVNNKYVNLNNGRVTSRDVVAGAGSLTINGNGTYVWRVEPEGKLFKGSWRLATKEEMGYQGGAGVVLQNAVEGSDWIAFKKMPQDGDKTDRLEVEHIKYRGSDRYLGRGFMNLLTCALLHIMPFVVFIARSNLFISLQYFVQPRLHLSENCRVEVSGRLIAEKPLHSFTLRWDYLKTVIHIRYLDVGCLARMETVDSVG